MSTAANFAIDQNKVAAIVIVDYETTAAPRTINDIRSVLRSCKTPFTIVLVQNGPVRPAIAEYLDAICFSEATIQCIKLGSRVSSQLAIRAGLQATDAEACIHVAADGSDDARVIANMVRKWKSGSDVVMAVRQESGKSRFSHRILKSVYRSLERRSSAPIDFGAADYCLMSRRVADALCASPADHRTLAQQTSRMGFRRSIVGMESTWKRPESFTSQLARHFRTLRETALSHSRLPIRMMYWSAASVFTISMLGSMVASAAIAFGASFTVVFTVLMSACLFAVSSVMASCLVMGEYLYRLMQNGPAQQSFAITDAYTQGCKLPMVQIRKSVSEEEILRELNSLRSDLRLQSSAEMQVANSN